MDELSEEDVKVLVYLFTKDTGIALNTEYDATNYKSVINWLEAEIRHLLNHDLQKLLNILYRIDIPEEKTKVVLSLENHEDMAIKFTELIVRRELQKVKTRKKYRNE